MRHFVCSWQFRVFVVGDELHLDFGMPGFEADAGTDEVIIGTDGRGVGIIGTVSGGLVEVLDIGNIGQEDDLRLLGEDLHRTDHHGEDHAELGGAEGGGDIAADRLVLALQEVGAGAGSFLMPVVARSSHPDIVDAGEHLVGFERAFLHVFRP